MNENLNIREIQQEEKKILDNVVKILNNNNLRYFLCGGTLLGAVRHKGFIPWDDDIDIAMPRPDYDKLQQLLIKNKIECPNKLSFHSLSLKNLNFPFIKVYNHCIEIYDYRYEDRFEKYLWIDIFPIDGFPESNKECIKWFKKRNKYKKMLGYRKMSNKFIFENKKNLLKNITKFVFKYICKIIPENFFAKKIDKLSKKYPYDSSRYAGCFSWGYGPQEKMEKKEFEEYIDVEFEESIYKSIKNYDLYLTNLYGDYMTLPPEDKRVTHSFEAWRVEENDEEIKK